MLQKYQFPEREAANPYARWYVMTQSPFTGTQEDYGDAYVKDVVSRARLIENPLHHFMVVGRVTIADLETIGLRSYKIILLDALDLRLGDYVKIMLPPGDITKVTRILQEHSIRVICTDCDDYLAVCLTDMQTKGEQELNR